MIELLSSCCLAGILTVAAYSDYTEYRVSNYLIVIGWCSGLAFRIYELGLGGVAVWICGTVSLLLLPVVLFLLRMFGAGDVKLISVIGGYTGVAFGLKVFAASIIIGGVFSFIRCVRYGYLINRLHYFAEYVSNSLRTRSLKPYYVKERDGEAVIIPFSIAIALGFIVVRLGFMTSIIG